MMTQGFNTDARDTKDNEEDETQKCELDGIIWQGR